MYPNRLENKRYHINSKNSNKILIDSKICGLIIFSQIDSERLIFLLKDLSLEQKIQIISKEF